MKNNMLRIFAAAVICTIAIVIVISNRINSATPEPGDIDAVILTISGEVKNPGSYTIKKGTSLWDNVGSFGGFNAKADISKVDIYAPIEKDKAVVIKPKSLNDNGNYDNLYQLPK